MGEAQGGLSGECVGDADGTEQHRAMAGAFNGVGELGDGALGELGLHWSFGGRMQPLVFLLHLLHTDPVALAQADFLQPSHVVVREVVHESSPTGELALAPVTQAAAGSTPLATTSAAARGTPPFVLNEVDMAIVYDLGAPAASTVDRWMNRMAMLPTSRYRAPDHQ
jgi:hypothetical protein